MPIYHSLGEIPRKRHTVFQGSRGRFHYEELVGNKGFTGPSSLLYHVNRPAAVRGERLLRRLDWEAEDAGPLRMRHLRSRQLPVGGGMVDGRVPLLFNRDIAVSVCRPDHAEDWFYRNAQGDELVYLAEGAGALESQFGRLEVGPGDYVVIPRGLLHRWRLDAAAGPAHLLVVESAGWIRTPERYRGELGQLLEHSPFCERDIRRPAQLATIDEEGEFPLVVKQGNILSEILLQYHPFDVAGWDGYYYPYAFNIADFEPIVGRIHQPPPVHQTFASDGFVVCSFVPRLFDFHPEAVPAPYHHANVMTDEVLFYASSEFMSRKGIEFGSLTLHPDGLVHGPHPGRAEASVGKAATEELAVMIDTFRPLQVARAALGIEDEDYPRSWLER
ncbi:MAG: homogentisate 1,2-dioxygenase [bacterium]|jgi:homogentisate 1,2-dioxygenase|nr:homogentisate 1,2-dioxygenase [bacterium]